MAFPTAILVFLGTFLLAAIAVWITRLVMDRADPDPAEDDRPAASEGLLFDSPILLEQEELSSISGWAWLLEKIDLVERLKTTIDQAGLNWSVGRVTSSMLLITTVSLALLNNVAWLPVWGMVAISGMLGMIPYLVVERHKEKRWAKIEEQLPDALESLSRSMRAGYAFGGAFEGTARETPDPLGRVFRKAVGESALGVPWERALENLAESLPMPEMCMFTAAVQMQNKSGGDISEVLDKLAENMRDGTALRGEVRSLSSQGRFAGYILTALPIGIVAVMMFVNPHFLDPLFNEEIGKTLLVCSFFALVAAHFIIRKLVDIKL